MEKRLQDMAKIILRAKIALPVMQFLFLVADTTSSIERPTSRI